MSEKKKIQHLHTCWLCKKPVGEGDDLIIIEYSPRSSIVVHPHCFVERAKSWRGNGRPVRENPWIKYLKDENFKDPNVLGICEECGKTVRIREEWDFFNGKCIHAYCMQDARLRAKARFKFLFPERSAQELERSFNKQNRYLEWKAYKKKFLRKKTQAPKKTAFNKLHKDGIRESLEDFF